MKLTESAKNRSKHSCGVQERVPECSSWSSISPGNASAAMSSKLGDSSNGESEDALSLDEDAERTVCKKKCVSQKKNKRNNETCLDRVRRTGRGSSEMLPLLTSKSSAATSSGIESASAGLFVKVAGN